MASREVALVSRPHPLSVGLFHAAISQSGSALNPRSSTTEGRERAHRLARALGIEARDDADMVRRLQQVGHNRN